MMRSEVGAFGGDGADEEFAAFPRGAASTVGHGLDGVEQEIEERLFEEIGVERAVRVFGGEGGEDATFTGLGLGMNEVDEVFDEGR